MTVLGRKFVVRTRDSHVASDIELRTLVNIVEENPADTLPLSPSWNVLTLETYKLVDDDFQNFLLSNGKFEEKLANLYAGGCTIFCVSSKMV